MSLITWILKKFIVPIPKIDAFKEYLFIGPHPDDIEVGAGATVSRLVEMGKKVTYLIATDGCYGSPTADYVKEDLIKTRQEEAIAAANYLGVKDVHFLPFSDCGLYDQTELMQAIAKKIIEIKPEAVFAPDPNLLTECHVDHLNVGKASASAYLIASNAPYAKEYADTTPASPSLLAFYYTDSPNTYFKTGAKHLKRQKEALKLFMSQMAFNEKGNGDGDFIMLYNHVRSIRFGVKKLKGRADGFRALGNTHTHCCAEKI